MFSGRLNRTTYILAYVFILAYMGIVSFGGLISEGDNLTTADIILIPASLFFLVWGIGLSIRRFHDLGLPGIMVLLTLLPGVIFVMAFLPGQKQANKYGPRHTKLFDFSVLFSKAKA